MFILEEEDSTLDELGILDEDQILIEIRNKDLTWPEELSSIASNTSNDKRQGELCIFFIFTLFIRFEKKKGNHQKPIFFFLHFINRSCSGKGSHRFEQFRKYLFHECRVAVREQHSGTHTIFHIKNAFIRIKQK